MDVDCRGVSLNPEIELDFADGTYLFALRLPQLVELEEKCGFTDRDGNRRRRGTIAIYADLIAGLGVLGGKLIAIPQEGRASATDAREVVRLALIGGGRGLVDGVEVEVSPVAARSLVERYIDTRPIVERWTIAAAVLRAAVEGYEPPKAEPAREPAAGGPKRRSRSRSRSFSPTPG